jgi:flagellar basal-body rod protein FlgG
MVAARTRLEIATQNLANASTDGYRRVEARGFLTALGVAIARRTREGGGALRHTGRDLDLAFVGSGAFRVRDAAGRVHETRAGAFVREADGTLHDGRGRVVLGLRGALRVPFGASIDARGRVVANGRICDALAVPPESRVQSGFLEASGVDAIAEMVGVLAAQRSFESAEKAVAAIDFVRQKSADAARVK